jgi:hypothetical protein
MLDFVEVDCKKLFIRAALVTMKIVDLNTSLSTGENSPGKLWVVNRVGDQVQLYFYKATDTSISPQNSINSTFIWGLSGVGPGRS